MCKDNPKYKPRSISMTDEQYETVVAMSEYEEISVSAVVRKLMSIGRDTLSSEFSSNSNKEL